MKTRLLTLLIVIVSALALSACIEVEVSDVESLSLIGWNAQEYYESSDTPLDLSSASITVTFTAESGEEPLSVDLSDTELVVSGTAPIDVQGKTLDLSDPGDYYIRFAYIGVSVTVNYKVVENLVDSSDDIATLFGSWSGTTWTDGTLQSGDSVYFAPGNYYISQPLKLTKSLNVVGPTSDSASVTLTDLETTLHTTNYQGVIFEVAASPVSISNMTLQLSANVIATKHRGIITVVTGATGTTTVTNNIMRGLWQPNILFANLYTQGIKHLSPGSKLVAHDNTIYNLRTGMDIYSNPGTEYDIQDNNIFHTKGGILFQRNSTHSLNRVYQLDNSIILNNTWDSTSPLYLSHNEWDIVYFGNVISKMTAQQILLASSNNNDAYILDRMEGTTMDDLTNNRSHSFVVLAEDLDHFALNINEHVYKTTTDGYNGYLLNDSNWYLDPVGGQAGDRGGNRDFYWKPATNLTMTFECVPFGGIIMQWDPAQNGGHGAFVEVEYTYSEWLDEQ